MQVMLDACEERIRIHFTYPTCFLRMYESHHLEMRSYFTFPTSCRKLFIRTFIFKINRLLIHNQLMQLVYAVANKTR